MVALLAVVGLVAHWIYHAQPTIALQRADTALSLGFCVVITGLLLVQVFRAGPITLYRIEGAVTAYILIAYSWALAYQLVALSDPAAFSFPAAALQSQTLRFRLLYFSTMTLTTVSHGDITPLSPVACSLAALEGVIGQIFLVLLLARLVGSARKESEMARISAFMILRSSARRASLGASARPAKRDRRKPVAAGRVPALAESTAGLFCKTSRFRDGSRSRVSRINALQGSFVGAAFALAQGHPISAIVGMLTMPVQ